MSTDKKLQQKQIRQIFDKVNAHEGELPTLEEAALLQDSKLYLYNLMFDESTQRYESNKLSAEEVIKVAQRNREN